MTGNEGIWQAGTDKRLDDIETRLDAHTAEHEGAEECDGHRCHRCGEIYPVGLCPDCQHPIEREAKAPAPVEVWQCDECEQGSCRLTADSSRPHHCPYGFVYPETNWHRIDQPKEWKCPECDMPGHHEHIDLSEESHAEDLPNDDAGRVDEPVSQGEGQHDGHDQWQFCPSCGRDLDTGWECTACGKDWMQYATGRIDPPGKNLTDHAGLIYGNGINPTIKYGPAGEGIDQPEAAEAGAEGQKFYGPFGHVKSSSVAGEEWITDGDKHCLFRCPAVYADVIANALNGHTALLSSTVAPAPTEEPAEQCDICHKWFGKDELEDYDSLAPNGEHQTGLRCPRAGCEPADEEREGEDFAVVDQRHGGSLDKNAEIARLAQEVERLKKADDCGCGISGCKNMRQQCRNCQIEEMAGIIKNLSEQLAEERQRREQAEEKLTLARANELLMISRAEQAEASAAQAHEDNAALRARVERLVQAQKSRPRVLTPLQLSHLGLRD